MITQYENAPLHQTLRKFNTFLFIATQIIETSAYMFISTIPCFSGPPSLHIVVNHRRFIEFLVKSIYIYILWTLLSSEAIKRHCRGCDSGCDILDILDRCRRVSVIEIILSNFQVEWQEYLQAAHRSNGVPLIRMQLWECLHDPRL